MASEQLIKFYLREAHQKGYLKPTIDTDVCLIDYVNNANNILRYIKEYEDSGASIEQLAKVTNRNENTIKVYCRELAKLGYLERSIENRFVIWRWKSSESQLNSPTQVR